MKNEIKLGNIKNFVDIEGLSEDAIVIRKQTSSGMVIDPNEEMTYMATISDTSTDMDQDCVYSKGCDVRTIMKNPVVLWSHQMSSPPVGKIVGLLISDNKIEAKIKMADTAQGKELWTLIKEGYLKTNSIGFIISKAVIRGQKEFNEFIAKSGLAIDNACNRIITEFTLIENSLCSIPSNGNALIQAVSTKSINVSDKLSKDLGIDKEIKEVKEIKDEEEGKNDKGDKGTTEDVSLPIDTDTKDNSNKANESTITENQEPKELEGDVTEALLQDPRHALPPPVIKVEEVPVIPVIVVPPVFTIIREGDYKPTQDDVKSYKSGKIILI